MTSVADVANGRGFMVETHILRGLGDEVFDEVFEALKSFEWTGA
jgi:hypothetical protein